MTTCNATDLSKALRLLKPLIWAKGSIPILKCVRLSAQGGVLSLTATDLDTEVTTAIPADGDLSPCALPHADLMAVVKGARGNVTLSAEGGVSAEGMSAKLTPEPVADWPAMRLSSAPLATWTCDGGPFRSALELVARAMSDEGTRYYLNGVFFDPPRPGCAARLVAADGHVLACHDLPPDYPGDAPPVILPRESVALALAAIPAKTAPVVSIEVHHAHMVITCGPDVIRSKLIDGSFPDYRRVIPKADDAMRLDLAGLDVTRIKGLSTKAQKRVVIQPGEGAAEGKVQSVTLKPGRGSPFAVNGALLHRLVGSEDATLASSNARGQPIRVAWPHRPDALGVIMPMTLE